MVPACCSSHSDRIWLAGELQTHTFAGDQRMAGMTDVLRSRALDLARHIECPWSPPDARQHLGDVFAGTDERPTAIIAINDRVALGVYQAAARDGLRVPDDLSVISFDNSDLAWWLDPALTSISLPYREMARRAVATLLDGSGQAVVEYVPMPLHTRESVASPQPGGSARTGRSALRRPARD